MPLYRKLLVATDFSIPAREAVRLAGRFARLDGASIVLVHVRHPGIATGAELPAFLPAFDDPSHRKRLENELDALRANELEGVPCELVVVDHASPTLALCELAAKRRVDLCVVGTHGRTGITRVLVGSVAERVVRHAPCDVLAVRPVAYEHGDRARVVVGTDLSGDADVAVVRAHELAKTLRGALSLVHVYDDRVPMIGEGRVILAPAEAKERRARELLELRRVRLADAPHIGVAVIDGHDAAEALGRFAANHRADFVVVGTHGRTGAERLFIGSVAERTVRLAPCPVLVVRSSGVA